MATVSSCISTALEFGRIYSGWIGLVCHDAVHGSLRWQLHTPNGHHVGISFTEVQSELIRKHSGDVATIKALIGSQTS